MAKERHDPTPSAPRQAATVEALSHPYVQLPPPVTKLRDKIEIRNLVAERRQRGGLTEEEQEGLDLVERGVRYKIEAQRPTTRKQKILVGLTGAAATLVLGGLAASELGQDAAERPALAADVALKQGVVFAIETPGRLLDAFDSALDIPFLDKPSESIREALEKEKIPAQERLREAQQRADDNWADLQLDAALLIGSVVGGIGVTIIGGRRGYDPRRTFNYVRGAIDEQRGYPKMGYGHLRGRKKFRADYTRRKV